MNPTMELRLVERTGTEPLPAMVGIARTVKVKVLQQRWTGFIEVTVKNAGAMHTEFRTIQEWRDVPVVIES